PGFRPPGWNPPAQSASSTLQKVDFNPSEMFHTSQFWLLWGVFLIGCASGLMIIMKASPIWQSFALFSLKAGIDPAQLNQMASAGALAVSILAIFNSLGRIVWGKISDLAGRKATLVSMFLICGLTMLAFNSLKPYPLFLAGISLVGLCFGGFLAVFPAVTADFFGTKAYGANYGWMFSAYGLGGLLGPYLAATLMKTSALIRITEFSAGQRETVRSLAVCDYRQAFIVAGILCLLSAAALLLLKRPNVKQTK
ncbi:MAG: MFS transporter, partial [Candidatus Saccharicenans sp.]